MKESPEEQDERQYMDSAEYQLDVALQMLPEHGRDTMKNYIMHGIPTGNFLSALMSNDLCETFGRADEFNRPRIYDYVFFLYNYAPSTCWGSREKVDAWIKRFADKRKGEQA